MVTHSEKTESPDEKQIATVLADRDKNVEESPPPDGGLFAWLQVLGSFMICFNNWGIVNSYGAYQAFYEDAYLAGYSPSSISWVGTVQGALLIMIGVISGPVFDYGYFRSMLLLGSFAFVFGLMMLSLSTQYYQIFLSQGLLVGLANGILFIPSIACVSTYFSSRRGIAIGLALSGSGIGGVIYPIVFRRLQPRIGFAWATRVIAFIALATLLVSCAVMRPRKSLKQAQRRKFLDPTALRDTPFMLFTAGSFFVFLGYYAPIFLTPEYGLTRLRISEDLSFYLLTVLNAAAFIARVFGSLIVDRVGAVNLLVGSNIAGAVVVFGWIGVHNLGGFATFCVLYGFFGGLIAMAPAATLPSLCPSVAVIGTRFGMAWFPAGVAVLVSTPIATSLASISDDGYLGAQLWAACTLLIGGILQIQPLIHLNRKARRDQ